MCKQALVISNNQLERSIAVTGLQENIKHMEEVREAETVDKALEVLDGFTPELVIQDMAHSSAGLLAVTKKVRQQNPEAMIIITSAKSESEVLSAASKAEANGYLLKPYSPGKLIAAVQKALAKKVKPMYEEDEDLQRTMRGNMMESFRQHMYKKSMKTAKEYIDSFFDSEDNENMRFTMTRAFLDILSEIEEEYGNLRQPVNRNKCETRYDAYVQAEGYIHRIYDLLEKEYSYGDDINKALNYIDINIRKGISLEDAAGYINVSTCYFSKLFKKTTGENFIAYVTAEKMELAKEMLALTQMPIVNIAYELSYTETNYFSKAFKKQTGMSPTEYRQAHFKEKKLA